MVQHCMGEKLRLLVDNQPVTEAFEQFLDHHYIPFLYDAIRSMLIVGFVPWRIRKANRFSQDLVPEVLPFGTYTWYVERTDEARQRREREQKNSIMRSVGAIRKNPFGSGAAPEDSTNTSRAGGQSGSKTGAKPLANVERGRPLGSTGLSDEPFLRYEVRAINSELATPGYRLHEHNGAEGRKLLFNYETTRPTGVLQCNSPLCGCLSAYVRLLNTRDCLRRANLFNSTGKVALVHQQEKQISASNISGRDLLGDDWAMSDALEDAETSRAKKQHQDATVTQRALDLSRLGARKPDAVTLPKVAPCSDPRSVVPSAALRPRHRNVSTR